MPLPKFTFLLGGAASGKSAYAENLVNACGKAKVYLASAQAYDDEMRARIVAHAARRGSDWTLIEAPMDAGPALTSLSARQVCLFDCATMWLSNQMLAGAEIALEQQRLLGAIDDCAATLVIVSNEVGCGIVPDTALGRRFRDAQGQLNIALAARADLAVLVVAGLPLVLKGRTP